MIIIQGSVRIDPAKVDVARIAIEKMVRCSRAEPGCIDYAFALDLFDEGLLRISERWTDRDALRSHAESMHMAEWRAAAASFNLHERALHLYEAEPEDL